MTIKTPDLGDKVVFDGKEYIIEHTSIRPLRGERRYFLKHNPLEDKDIEYCLIGKKID